MTQNPALQVLLTAALIGSAAGGTLPSGSRISLIPRPLHQERLEGDFTVTSATQICAPGVSPGTVALLKNRFRESAGFDLPVIGRAGREFRGISIVIDTSSLRDGEGYRLSVSRTGVRITGGGDAGAFYGVQTLLQLFPPSLFAAERTSHGPLSIPCCLIEDAPRFRWRGMHLDVSRHFFPVEFIKKYIDILAMHKLNVFHWHLTDDQGWRIEIRKYPELTRTGAWRVDREDRDWMERPPAQPGERATYGGFYTQDQIRDVVQYARERFVTILPEIEMPAHALAALAAYPEFSCSGGPFTVPPGSYWPISTIFCAGNDSTFGFLQDVLSEVMDLFPGQYIHIGGDEADKSEWKKCPKCQRRIRAEGLSDESQLQSYFIRRIESFVRAKGRRLIGWDEILEGGLAPGAAVMSWRGMEGGVDAARMGHDVIMAPSGWTYFNEYQGPAATEPHAGGGFLPLRKVYSFEPVPDTLVGQERAHVLGAEGCLWTEYVPTPGRALYMLLPRLAALAEVLWSPPDGRDWGDFAHRITLQRERYNAAGYTSALSAYAVRIGSEADASVRGVRITLSTELPADSILYTTDGSDPVRGSAVYTTPLLLHSSAVIRASAILGETVLPPSADTVLFHRAVFRKVLSTAPSPKYAAGEGVLTDGLFGSLDQADGRWLGYEGEDFSAVVDLGETTAVSCCGARFLQNTGSWIFFPARVMFEVSTDGNAYASAGSLDVTPAQGLEPPSARLLECSFAPREARYIRIRALNIGTCPAWHPGAGGKAWMFVDEIVVR